MLTILSLLSTTIAYIAGITFIYAIYAIWTNKASTVILAALLFAVTAFYTTGYIGGRKSEKSDHEKSFAVLEAKITAVEHAASAIAKQSNNNMIVVEKVIKQKGDTIIKYIDIPAKSCKVSPQFVETINQAAK